MDGSIVNDFVPFPKIARLSREVIVTEKIDGTNAMVEISDTGEHIRAGSRTRWITPLDDNFGFAGWVAHNRDELLKLGPGRHYGEWWGHGIQRGYGLAKGDRRFSLFNVSRWADERPTCCSIVPVLWRGLFDTGPIYSCLSNMAAHGSVAAPGFMKPEGVVVFHPQGNILFKKTFEKDAAGKDHGA